MRAEIFTIFPELVSTWAGASLIGKAWRSGAIDIVVHDLRAGANDPRRSVDDSPFGGGAGHGPGPRAGVRGRGGSATRETALPARPGWSALRPGDGPRAGGRPGFLAALRALRGRRRAGRRASCGRRAVDWRLRARRRGGGGRCRGRGGGAFGARASWATWPRPTRRASPKACSSTRSTRGPPSSAAGPSPRCSCPVTTRVWPSGGRPRHSPARWSAGQI